MKTRDGTGPPLAVERDFECNRLAESFQARAYEQVVPLIKSMGTRLAEDQVEMSGEERERVIQGGIAA